MQEGVGVGIKGRAEAGLLQKDENHLNFLYFVKKKMKYEI